MRALLSAALVVLLAACPSSSGPRGEDGPQGPAGAQGPQGPKGDRGDTGETGAVGATGAAGTTGPQGATGEQGVQGPAGMVLVLDGGVVVGPAGSSVVVTPIPVGGATCPTGGIRVTQVSDGGISNVCNGDVGPQGVAGPVGPAGPIGATGSQGVAGAVGGVGPAGPTGPIGVTGSQGPTGPVGGVGPAGPQGAQGASVTVTVLASMSPQCMTGGVSIGYPDGGASTVCNGAQGSQGVQGVAGPQGIQGLQGVAGNTGSAGPAGPAGPTGSAGPSGPTGSTGPAGPAGAVLYVDGGVLLVGGGGTTQGVSFAGYTVASFMGDLGGNVGANQKCSVDYPGSFFCTRSDFARTEPGQYPPAAGAWLDGSRDSNGFRSNNDCYTTANGGWSHAGTGDDGFYAGANGQIVWSLCNVARPLACCRAPRAVAFRGFTSNSYNGNLGGNIGANAKCRAEFPGTVFCTRADFSSAEVTVSPGSNGAWLDGSRDSNGFRSNNDCYTTANGGWSHDGTGDDGFYVGSNGQLVWSLCNVQRPIACCQVP